MSARGFRAGDIVRYRGKFLRSIQWCLSVPINGRVESVGDPLHTGGPAVVRVLWCDRDEEQEILSCNIELDPRCATNRNLPRTPDHIRHEPADYEERVSALEAEGLTRSDAQGVVDLEEMRKRGAQC